MIDEPLPEFWHELHVLLIDLINIGKMLALVIIVIGTIAWLRGLPVP